jgi:hypothetical protein
MMQVKRIITAAIAGAMLVMAGAAAADDALLKPFVLASNGPGEMAEKIKEVTKALTENGFTIAGEYSPYANAEIIVVTNDALKKNAAQSDNGGFGAIQRVALTKVDDKIQVSYTNPVYMANAYRMKGDLSGVSAQLAKALGKVQEFGAQGLSVHELRKYHYMIGMEYFTDPSTLAHYKSHQEALDAVENGLKADKYGVSKVYRVDVPGTQESLFGVAMKGSGKDGKYMDDKFIMSVIDFGKLKSTAHLPYEVLVNGNDVLALYARFRIAIDFPDLSMMGSNSFMKIMDSPEAIRHALQNTVGGGK